MGKPMTANEALQVYELLLEQLGPDELTRLAEQAGVDEQELKDAQEAALREKP